MAANDDDLLRLLRSGDLRNDVPRNAIGQRACLHLEPRAERFAAGLHPREHVGVLQRERGVRDFPYPIGVRHAAGVRRLHRERPNRSNQARHRPGPRRVNCPLRADDHRLAILGERHVEEDDFSLDLSGTILEIVKPCDHQHVRRNAFGRRADAAAQAEHRQLAAAWRKQLDRLAATNPARDGNFLSPNVSEAVFFHLSETPVYGGLEIFRAGKAGPKRVTHRGQARKPKQAVRRRQRQPLGFRLIIRRRATGRKPSRHHQAERQKKEKPLQVH